MQDDNKTKAELLAELASLRGRLAELEAPDNGRARGEPENSHGWRLLLALSQAAQAMQRAHTPKEVYRAIGEQAVRLGYDATVITLSDDREHLILSHCTLQADLVQAAEALTGQRFTGFRFPLKPDGYFQRIIAAGETVFDQLDTTPFVEALPRRARPLAGRLLNLLGWQQVVIAPLAVGGQVQGLLVVTGAGLTENDTPTVAAFANQAAIAIENSRLYRQMQHLAAFNESVIQSMAEGIVLENAEGFFTFANQAAGALLGYVPDEIVGLHWTDIIPPDQHPIVRAADERRMRGKTDRYELELVRKDGRRITVLVGGSPSFDQAGRFTGSMAVFTDITERVQAEGQIKSLARFPSENPNPVLRIDLHGCLLYANQAADSILAGWDLRVGWPVPEVLQSLAQATNGQRVNMVDIPCGERVISVAAARSSEAGYVNLYARDITERKQAEHALRRSERFLQDVFDAIRDGISVLDADLNVIRINRRIEEMYAQQMPLMGRKCYQVYQQRQSPCPWCPSLPTIETGDVHTEIVPYPSSDNPEGWIELSAFPIKDENGRVVNVIEYVKDVSERKRAEDERRRLNARVREQARQMEQVLATVPEGVLLLDAVGRVLHANPVAEGDLSLLAGARVDDTLTYLGDRPLAELLTSPTTQGLWHEVKQNGRTFEAIARPMEHVTGSDASSQPPGEDGSEPENWVMILRDVSQEREIHRHIQQQERLAAVGQLAAGIAHDFNNIIAVIVLYTQMSLTTPGLPAKVRERLETVSRQASRATDLIQQILDFSRRAVLERRPMDLTPFLKEMAKLLERTVQENIQIDLTYGADEYTVSADPTRLQQALMNLAVNARDAMPEGGELKIILSRTAGGDRVGCVSCNRVAPGEWVRIEVTDTGSGIPPDVLPYIFDPFFSTKAPGEGTGLGLPQVYGIVKQHEGHIDVTTKVGDGTSFIIYLPALLEQQPHVPAMEPQTFVQGQGETILVVEDNATLREALVNSLVLLNYRALEAANGRQALEVLDQCGDQVSLVLSDLVMPEMGGQALFRAINQRGLKAPMVMMSGHPMEDVLKSLQEQGLAGWVLKPLNITQLSQSLARALRGETP